MATTRRTRTPKQTLPPEDEAPIEALAHDPGTPVPSRLTPSQRLMLEADLDPRRVSTRQGTGKRLSYLETHDVKRNANRIFGFDGWGTDQLDLVCLGEEEVVKGDPDKGGKRGWRTAYRATITVVAGGVPRSDVGYGDAVDYTGSKLAIHELAVKEAVSDAIKRCLSSWGDQFGLVLYGADKTPDVESPAEPVGKPVAAPPAEPMASKEEFEAMCLLSKEVGVAKEDLVTICQTEKSAHGGYRQSWVDAQLDTLNKLSESQAGGQ